MGGARPFEWRPPPTWTVFDPEGAVLGSIPTPPGLPLYQIGEDFLLGRRRNEVVAEQVVLYSLDRGGQVNGGEGRCHVSWERLL